MEDLQNMTLEIMTQMKDNHNDETGEYKTIMMNLTTVSRELNILRTKEVAGDVNK